MSAAIEAQLTLNRDGFQLEAQLTIAAAGITALFGPSGAGKTTLLRALAGLEHASGTLRVDGEIWQENDTFLPPHKRAVGYVFQESSLFDHLPVQANLEYGFKRAAGSSPLTFDAAVELLSLATLLNKYPAELSGGERKRTAIARALLRNPRVMLLDEPLASLDIHHQREVLPFLERLHKETAMPMLYVSHSPDEIARIADHLILMDAGAITASGTLNDVLTRFDLPVAHEADAGAVIETHNSGYDPTFDLSTLSFGGGELQVAGTVPDATARVRILARDVSLTLARQTDTSILNILPAVVTDIAYDKPGQVLLKLDAKGTTLLSRITQKSRAALNIESGTEVFAQIKTVALLDS